MKTEDKIELVYGIVRLVGIVTIGLATNWMAALGVTLLVVGTQLALMHGTRIGIAKLVLVLAEELNKKVDK